MGVINRAMRLNGKGIVVSDLHLFTRRSGLTSLVQALPRDNNGLQYLVLNGDIFDFRWSTFRDNKTTVMNAVTCLKDLLKKNSFHEVHYVVGNHDCHINFISELDKVENGTPSFFVHRYFMKMQDRLFLHGDCCNRLITHQQLMSQRQKWEQDARRPDWQARAYALADSISLTKLFHTIYFPKKVVARRALYYMKSLPGSLPEGIAQVYLGHSHIPFKNYPYQGYCFNNSGSGIRGMGYEPVYF